jgi:hypothetical protein
VTITLPQRRGWIPPGQPRIDWNNPISNGLVGAYLPSASLGPNIYDLTGLGPPLALTSGTTYAPGRDGTGLFGNATGEGAFAAPSSAQMPSTTASVFTRVTFASSNPSANVTIGVTNVNSGFSGANGFDIDFDSFGDVFAECSTSTGTFSSTTLGSFNTGDTNSYSLSLKAGGNLTFYSDGSLIDTTATTGTSIDYGSGGNAAQTAIWRVNADFVRNPNMTCYVMLLWNRVLSDQEHRWLGQNPYGLFVFPDDELFATQVGSATTLNVTSSATIGAFTQTATATNKNHLVSAKTLAAFTQTATATNKNHLVSAKTLGAFTQVATVTSTSDVSSSATIGAFTQSASATNKNHLVSAKTLAAFTQTAAATNTDHITSSATIPAFTQTAIVIAPFFVAPAPSARPPQPEPETLTAANIYLQSRPFPFFIQPVTSATFVVPGVGPYVTLSYFPPPRPFDFAAQRPPQPGPFLFTARPVTIRTPFKGRPAVAEYLQNEVEHRAQLARTANLAIQGKLNATVDVTLTASATTTTVTDSRIGVTSHISLMPQTAAAATAQVAGIHVTDRTKGSCVLNHASNSATDQNFVCLIIG